MLEYATSGVFTKFEAQKEKELYNAKIDFLYQHYSRN